MRDGCQVSSALAHPTYRLGSVDEGSAIDPKVGWIQMLAGTFLLFLP
jgi:hypothetical protein